MSLKGFRQALHSDKLEVNWMPLMAARLGIRRLPACVLGASTGNVSVFQSRMQCYIMSCKAVCPRLVVTSVDKDEYFRSAEQMPWVVS